MLKLSAIHIGTLFQINQVTDSYPKEAMGKLAQSIISLVNPFFKKEEWFDQLNKSEDHALQYALKGGEVVLGQFDGFNNLQDKIVVDYGCGFGGKTVYYAQTGPRRIYGVDYHGSYDLAETYAREHGLPVEFLRLSEDGRISLPDDIADVVISSAVFEHVLDIESTAGEIRRVLKPGGLFLNRWHPYRTRYGGHLGGVIGIPFVHLFFSEKDLVRSFYREVSRKNSSVSGLLLYRDLTDRAEFFRDLGLVFNYLTVRNMNRHIQSCGFQLMHRGFVRNKTPVRWAKLLPEAVVDFFIDHEVCVYRKQA